MTRLPSLLLDTLRFRQGASVGPRFLTYTVTFHCNARCVMCDSWRKPSPEELSVAELEGIFAQFPKLDAVRLTGGEPFVRQDLVTIATLAHERLRPTFLHVTTNGFLTDRIVAFCEDRPKSLPLRLLVSLDGVGDYHNNVRGRETAWEAATATLSALAPRQRDLGLQLSVNQTVVDAAGIEQMRRLRSLLAPLGVRHQAVLAYRGSAMYDVATESLHEPSTDGAFVGFGRLDDREVDSLIAELNTSLASLPLPERIAKQYYIRGLSSRLKGHAPSPKPPCVALNAHLRMLPNGDIPICQFNTLRVGSLRRQTLAEALDSAAIHAGRAWVKRCHGCWAECEALPNALYSGDIVGVSIRAALAKMDPRRRKQHPPTTAQPGPASEALQKRAAPLLRLNRE